ncbi:MAG: hypothetical protein HYS07_03870 [Chlamydiae bacterium]|nr:hypothetical protein [Chlamydiota bacterium]
MGRLQICERGDFHVNKELDPEDPMEMVGVEFSLQSEAEVRDMALCYAEEFARDGWNEEKLLAMFRNPFYLGPHLVWRQKGDSFVLSVIQEAIRMWQPKTEDRRQRTEDRRQKTEDRGKEI